MDRSVASSDLPQASQDGQHATAVQEMEKKYKVQPGTVGFEIGGLLFMKDELWEILGFYESQTKDPKHICRTVKWAMIPLSCVNSLPIREKKLRMFVKLLSFTNKHAVSAESVFWCPSMLYVGKLKDSTLPEDDIHFVAAVRWSEALRFTLSNRTI